MVNKKIIIEIDKQGAVVLKTEGYTGTSCVTDTKIIKQILGKESRRALLPSYFEEGGKVQKKYLSLCG